MAAAGSGSQGGFDESISLFWEGSRKNRKISRQGNLTWGADTTTLTY